MKKQTKRMTCIDDRCFTNDYDAGKYLLEVACEHRKVKIRNVKI